MKANLEKRIQQIEGQIHERKWPNRPLTEEEEAYYQEIIRQEAEELNTDEH